MEVEIVIETFKEYGYLGIYFWLWLGMLGIPIPNEVIVTTIGYLTKTTLLEGPKTFMISYLGIISSLTTSYLFGRLIGSKLLTFFSKYKRPSRSIERSISLIHKLHVYALSISYFLPGARNFVPFLFGTMKLPFLRFAIFSYLTSFFWFVIFFSFGRFSKGNERLSIIVSVGAIAVVTFVSLLVRMKKRKNYLNEQLQSKV